MLILLNNFGIPGLVISSLMLGVSFSLLPIGKGGEAMNAVISILRIDVHWYALDLLYT